MRAGVKTGPAPRRAGLIVISSYLDTFIYLRLSYCICSPACHTGISLVRRRWRGLRCGSMKTVFEPRSARRRTGWDGPLSATPGCNLPRPGRRPLPPFPASIPHPPCRRRLPFDESRTGPASRSRFPVSASLSASSRSQSARPATFPPSTAGDSPSSGSLPPSTADFPPSSVSLPPSTAEDSPSSGSLPPSSGNLFRSLANFSRSLWISSALTVGIAPSCCQPATFKSHVPGKNNQQPTERSK